MTFMILWFYGFMDFFNIDIGFDLLTKKGERWHICIYPATTARRRRSRRFVTATVTVALQNETGLSFVGTRAEQWRRERRGPSDGKLKVDRTARCFASWLMAVVFDTSYPLGPTRKTGHRLWHILFPLRLNYLELPTARAGEHMSCTQWTQAMIRRSSGFHALRVLQYLVQKP